MDEKNSIDRKLKLLKESLAAGVIDAEEYSRNKAKLEEQIERIHALSEEAAKEKPKEQEQGPPKESTPSSDSESSTQEPPSEQSPEQKEYPSSQEEPPAEQGAPSYDSYDAEKEAPAASAASSNESLKPSSDLEPSKEPSLDSPMHEEEEKPEPAYHPPKKESRTLAITLWVIGAIGLLGLLLLFSITLQKGAANETSNYPGSSEPIYACSRHSDCSMQGMESRCRNPATMQAYCERKNLTEVRLFVLNAECSSCDPSRVIGILQGWFALLTEQDLSADSELGKGLIAEYGITMLPAYILSKSIDETLQFEDVRSAFRISGDSYVLKEGAAGSALYIDRRESPRTVDVFLSTEEDSSKKALLNMQEFTEAFGNEATIRIHYAKGENSTLEASRLLSSLGLPTPSFLINNILKAPGVLAADTLRAHYCERNPGITCDIELRKSLI